MEEKWKRIKAPGPKCEISNLGRVRQKRMIRKGVELKDVIRKLSISPTGFQYLGFRGPLGQENKYVHLLVAEAFVPGKGRVEHIDRIRTNNKADNLRRVR